MVWARPGAAGVEFLRPLTPSAVAHYVATLPPDLSTYGGSAPFAASETPARRVVPTND